MAVPVPVPKLGPAMAGGLVAEWYLPDGSAVGAGDAVFRLECDCVAVEVEAECDGVLRHRFDGGVVCRPGEVAAVILTPGERLPAEYEPSPPAALHLATPPADTPEEAWPVTIAAEVAPAPDEPSPPVREQAEPIPLRPRSRLEPRLPLPPTPELPPAAFEEAAVPDFGDDSAFAGEMATQDFAWPEEDPGIVEEPDQWVPGPVPSLEQEPCWSPDEASRPAAAEAPFPFYGVPDEPAASPEKHREEPAPVFETPALVAPPVLVRPATSVHLASAPFLRVTVGLAEATKMRAQLAREWAAGGFAPGDEDIVLRATARALHEDPHFASLGDAIAFSLPSRHGSHEAVLPRAAVRGFRDAVAAMAGLAPAGFVPGRCAATVTSFARLDIDDGVPQLRAGEPVAIAAGAARTVAVFESGRAVPATVMTLTLAFDVAAVPEGVAAHLLSRIRDLVEAPYALLLD